MILRHVPVLLPLLALAACGGGSDMPANNDSAQDSAVVEEAPSQLQDDPNNSVVPIGNVAQPQPVAAIPQGFRGRWGLVPNDCDPKRADNKGLMTVEATMLRFYESRAVASKVAATDAVMTADLAFSGEGQTWTQQGRFTLQNDGRTLVREGGEEGTLTYSKCPALTDPAA
jgi:hypothetical protein